MTGILSKKCIVRWFHRLANVLAQTSCTPRLLWYSLLLLGYKSVQHVTVLNTVGNCNTMVLYTYYNNIILWDHPHICDLLLTEMLLCGA